MHDVSMHTHLTWLMISSFCRIRLPLDRWLERPQGNLFVLCRKLSGHSVVILEKKYGFLQETIACAQRSASAVVPPVSRLVWDPAWLISSKGCWSLPEIAEDWLGKGEITSRVMP